MSDPQRIVDGGTEELDAADARELRELLGAARRDLPDADRMAAVFARLPPVVGPGGGGGGPAAASGAALAKAGAAKTSWWIAGLVGVGAIAVGVGVTRTPNPGTPTPTASTLVEPSPVPVAGSGATSPATAMPSASTVTASAAPLVSSTAPVPSPSVASRPEIEILKDAQAASGSNPARVLTLVAEHERSWPRGMLGQERDMLRIQALVALGRRPEAKQRAEAFRKSYPKSAYVQRLDAMFP